MGFELGVLFAFGAMLCWGFGDFFIQRSARKIGDIEALAFIGIIGSIGLLPFVLQEIPLLFSLPNLVLLSFIGIVTFVFAVVDFEALKKGKLSVVEVILEFELPLTVLLGFFFFQESLSMQQFGIILLIFAGIVLIAIKSFSRFNPMKGLEKGVFIAFIGAIGMAVINFLTAYGSKQVSPIMAIWVPWLVFTIVSLFLIWRREGLRELVQNAKKHYAIILGMGIFDTLAWLFFATAVLKNELAITIAITESYVAVALILGVLINKEKILLHQYAGAAIVLIASFALGLMV
ncbi:MAG: DMT family transporter [Candidatus ainarchaeum sp.]|nr:DMT family transporter [Candidatus ainarchaeum sp.]